MNAHQRAVARAKEVPVGSLVLCPREHGAGDALTLTRTRSIVFQAHARQWVRVVGRRTPVELDQVQVLDQVPEGREAELVALYLGPDPVSTLVLRRVCVPELNRERLLAALRDLEARGLATRAGETGTQWRTA